MSNLLKSIRESCVKARCVRWLVRELWRGQDIPTNGVVWTRTVIICWTSTRTRIHVDVDRFLILVWTWTCTRRL